MTQDKSPHHDPNADSGNALAGGDRGSAATGQSGSQPHQQRPLFLDRMDIAKRMKHVKHKILVVSGKGGVGKSTVAVNLAVALASAGKRVGLLDIDVHGPSVPTLLGLQGRPVAADGKALIPVKYSPNLVVMSIGFLIEKSEDAVIWRGPMKFSVIKQFLKDVDWGKLDYLVVDSPPGTGDEPLSVAQLIPEADGAVMVTTPQDVATADVRRCISFCRQLNVAVLGVVENMSGMVCPECGTRIDLFKSGGGRRMARDVGVPFLGAIPIDPKIVEATDAGTPYAEKFDDTPTARAFERVIAPILALDQGEGKSAAAAEQKDGGSPEAPKTSSLKIAIPLAGDKPAARLGEADAFAMVDAERESNEIQSVERVSAPDQPPGLLPQWLEGRGVDVVIAGGMVDQARTMLEERGIEVRLTTAAESPERLAALYLTDALPES